MKLRTLMHHAGRRLIRAMILVLAVSAFSFCLFDLAPGDYFDEFRSNPAISNDTITALRRQFGTDQPIFVRYLRWLSSLARGDWGLSLVYNTPVRPLLFDRAANTVVLTSAAALCGWVLAVPFALVTTGAGRGRSVLATAFVAVLLSMPDLTVVLLLVAVAAHFTTLPVGGMSSLHIADVAILEKTQDLIAHLIVPLAALTVATLPVLILHTRAAIAEALEAPFVQFARANGIPRRRLLIRQVLPAAMSPLITLAGFSVGTLLSSSVIVEAVVGWPGMGHLLFHALLQRDLVLVAGALLLSSLFLIAGNFLADVALYATDPRINGTL